MGFLDKLKGAVKFVTGGAAKVTLEFQPQQAFPGDKILVKVSATSTGGEVKSKGAFIDLLGREEVEIKQGGTVNQHVHVTHETLEQAFPISGEFVLAANETKLFEGAVQLPATCLPTYQGHYAKHVWQLRARVEASGTDPSSDYVVLRVGLK